MSAFTTNDPTDTDVSHLNAQVTQSADSDSGEKKSIVYKAGKPVQLDESSDYEIIRIGDRAPS